MEIMELLYLLIAIVYLVLGLSQLFVRIKVNGKNIVPTVLVNMSIFLTLSSIYLHHNIINIILWCLIALTDIYNLET